MKQSNTILIFDTTLRDGEQAPGNSMKTEEKLQVLTWLKKLRVDIIEAGFPAASQGDLEAVRAIAQACGEPSDPRVCALARIGKNIGDYLDIDMAAAAIRDAAHKRIHVFIATSPIHMRDKLRMEPDEVLSAIRWGVAYAMERAREIGADVEFSCEDATRSDWNFLKECYQTAINQGATTINIPDTVGYTLPDTYGRLFAFLRGALKDREGRFLANPTSTVIMSAHGHDDIGLATANFLAACQNGARQVECTLLGVGERAGNGRMEAFVAALATHHETLGFTTAIERRFLTPACEAFARIINLTVEPHHAVVGFNAFAHESGIHQDGVLKNSLTYEHMEPHEYGNMQRIVLGKHSGRHAFRARVNEFGLGMLITDDQVVDLSRRCKAWADENKKVPDLKLLEIIAHELLGINLEGVYHKPSALLHLIWQHHMNFVNPFEFVEHEVQGDRVRVGMKVGGIDKATIIEVGEYSAIDGIFKAIHQLSGMREVRLGTYRVISTENQSSESDGRVYCQVFHGDDDVEVEATDKNIERASALAFVTAFNRLFLKLHIRELNKAIA